MPTGLQSSLADSSKTRRSKQCQNSWQSLHQVSADITAQVRLNVLTMFQLELRPWLIRLEGSSRLAARIPGWARLLTICQKAVQLP